MTTKTAMWRFAQKLWPKGGIKLSHWRRIVRVTMRCVGLTMALVVLIQVLYPADRALPFLYLGGIEVGGSNREAIIARLSDFAESGKVTLVTPSRQWQPLWSEVGLTIDREASATAALEYAWWERLIPFSSIMRIIQSRQAPFVALVDQDRMRAFADRLVAEDIAAAQEAVIKVIDGRVQIDAAKSGYKFEVNEVIRQIQSLPLQTQSTIHLVPQPIPPTRSQAALQKTQAQAEVMLSRDLQLQVGDRQFHPDRKEIGEWLAFTEDLLTKQLQVSLNYEALRQYLGEIDKAVQLPAGTTTVTLLDGQVVGRTEAQAGRTVAIDAAIAAIEKELRATEATTPVVLQVASVPPTVNYVRTYSQASSGLQALIRDWEAANYGDYGIIVRELSGQHRYAEHQPDKRFVTASTYKMFLAYTVFQKIDQGIITSGQRTDMGWTVDQCIREMIVNSTNPCAISLQNLVGWEETDRMLRDAGFTATFLNNQTSGDKYSTVRDETNFMLRTYSHSLMSPEHSEYLMSLFKRQIWRAGIPSGVPRGTVVANKVGLYNNWVHDVAIVFGPKSTYILGIMSKGGSDPQFADLSRRVYNFFNQ